MTTDLPVGGPASGRGGAKPSQAGSLAGQDRLADSGGTAVIQKAPSSLPSGEPGPDTNAGRPAGLGVRGWMRWIWRQLTSMRTALVLLFLLALASIPGSVLPQQGIDPSAVSRYYSAHPSLAPILARLSLFDVFGAPWFAAIYLLLFTSLAGCVLPRAMRFARSVRQPPPKAPRHLSRLPAAVAVTSPVPPEAALRAATSVLRGRRFRLRSGDGWVSGEKGYLHEFGNLLFHVALLGLLGSVALGGLFGYKGNRLLVEGQTFANTPTALDVFRPGRLVGPSDLQPFTVTLRHFSARYVTSGPQRDEPLSYNARVTYTGKPGGGARGYDLKVNHPLTVDGVQVFLINHGYAPVIKVTDGTGQVRFDQPVPFIPIEQAGLSSSGVIKVPDSSPKQLGFAGVFLPTAIDVNGRLASEFPAALLPRISLVAYAGKLGLGSGTPQSVYSLDTRHMRELSVSSKPLAPGQSMILPHGLGKLTFVGYRQWVSLAITYDPGQFPALISALVALTGLIISFMVRRRRMFVRVKPTDGGGSAVEVGGLARSDAAGGFEVEFQELTGELARSLRAASADSGQNASGTQAAVPAQGE